MVQPAMPCQSMYAARLYSSPANTRLSFLTSRLCAARAPTGAVSTLALAMISSAGRYR